MNPKTKLFSNKQINTRPLKWYRIREFTLFAVFIDFRYMIAVFTGIVLILSVLTQCKSGKNNKSIDSIQHIDTTSFITSSGSDSTNKEVKPEKMDTAATVSFLLPSPDEILSEIFGDKISVNLELINSELNAKKYISNKKISLNLGVYITDFAYLNLNNNTSEALNYFKLIRDLSQKVNIYGLFNENTLNRLENNLTQKDSMNVITKEVYYNLLSVLESSKRNNLYALIASGALVESLYLSSMIVTNYSDYQVVAKKIFEQKYVLANFYDFASQYASDPDVKSILEHMQMLKGILQGAGVKSSAKKVKTLSKNQFEINGGEDIIVTQKNFELFKENVIKIRKDIVNITN